jgi:hypothetical protein
MKKSSGSQVGSLTVLTRDALDEITSRMPLTIPIDVSSVVIR